MRFNRYWRVRGNPIIAVVLIVAGVCVVLAMRPLGWLASPPSSPPPPKGYFQLHAVGSYARLPDDATAVAEVRHSTWEPRPGNAKYNHVLPADLRLRPVSNVSRAYDPRWNTYIRGRITGHFTGTTDEIFQWAAAKWGLPDDLLRTIAYMESDWRQSNHGDYVDDRALCPPQYQDVLPCPVTFGIVGTKSISWPGIFPWNRDSTAAAVDVLGGWLRGCYEGWAWWLRDHGDRSHGVYHAGDIWGCVGTWYSGDWFDGSATAPQTGEHYIAQAQHWIQRRPWLRPGFLPFPAYSLLSKQLAPGSGE